MASTRVTFARDHVSPGGKHYKGGSTHSVEFHEARSLLNRGTVRLADEPEKTPDTAAAKPETQKTDNKEK